MGGYTLTSPRRVGWVRGNDLPNLNIPLGIASLSISRNLNQAPSASLTIDGLLQNNYTMYRETFALEKIFTFYDLRFVVTSYEETKRRVRIEDIDTFVYSVSVGFGSEPAILAEKAIRLEKITRTSGGLTVNNLATAVGVKYEGPNFTLNIESTATGNTTLNLSGEVTNRLGYFRKFFRYTDKLELFTLNPVATQTPVVGAPTLYGGTLISNFINQPNAQTSSQPVSNFITSVASASGTGGTSAVLSVDAFAEPIRTSYTINSGYDNTELQWNKAPKSSGYELQEPEVIVLHEGDIEPDKPPKNTTCIKTLDLNFDQSGPTKTLKVTKTINGTPEYEEIYRYGFVYTSMDIRDDDGTAVPIDDPSIYWKQIEYSKTVYLYSKPAKQLFSIYTKDPVTGNNIPVAYDQTSYEKYNKQEIQYLIGSNTTGWKLGRFATEDQTMPCRTKFQQFSEAADPLDRDIYELEYKTYLFNKIPYSSKTRYKLTPMGRYYKDINYTPPYTMQKVPISDLKINPSFADANGNVTVVTVDPNYVMPFIVEVETSQNNCFAKMKNPKHLDWEEGSADPEPPEYLTTGEDSFSRTERKVMPSKSTLPIVQNALLEAKLNVAEVPSVLNSGSVEVDKFIEFSSTVKGQDGQYKSGLEDTRFGVKTGKPPSPTIRTNRFKDESNNEAPGQSPETKYYLTSAGNRKYSTDYPTEVNFPFAKNYEEALAQAKFELSMKEMMEGDKITLALAFHYPEIREGDVLNIDTVEGPWVVLSVSHNLTYKAKYQNVPLCVASPTSVTLGKWVNRAITVTSKVVPADGNTGVTTTLNISHIQNMGEELIPGTEPTRRNF